MVGVVGEQPPDPPLARCVEGLDAGSREQVEKLLVAEEDEQEEGDPERGRRPQAECNAGQGPICGGVLTGGLEDAERDPDQVSDEQADDVDFDRDRQAFGDSGDDGLLVLERPAEIERGEASIADVS